MNFTTVRGRYMSGPIESFVIDSQPCNAMALTHVHVPESQRRQGQCKALLDRLEQEATDAGLYFVVGPLFNEHLAEYLIQKRHYRPIAPVSALYESKT